MNPPKRILHVTTFVHPDKHGGAERVVHGIAKGQAAAGHHVTVLTANHDQLPPREALDGFEMVRYSIATGRRGIRFFSTIARSCRRALHDLSATPFDILHAHQVASATTALRSKAVARRRLFSFYAPYSAEFGVERTESPTDVDGISNEGVPRLRWRHRFVRGVVAHLDRDALRHADRIVVLSDFSRQQIGELASDVLPNVVKVYPGVDVTRFSPGDRLAARERLSLPPDAPLAVTVRRLTKRMGIHLAIGAVAKLVAEGTPVKLVIAGEGPERAALETEVSRRNLAPHVHFLGRVAEEDLPDLYRAADLFVLPTIALEGFGMVTLEALACATPVIATAIGATPEVLARLTPDIDPVAPTVAALAEGIRNQLARPELASSARRAAERIPQEFGWNVVTEQLDRVYDNLLRRPGGAG